MNAALTTSQQVKFILTENTHERYTTKEPPESTLASLPDPSADLGDVTRSEITGMLNIIC